MVDIGLYHEDVVNCYVSVTQLPDPCNLEFITFMLSPFAVARCFVMYPSQKPEAIQWYLFCSNVELWIQLPLCRPSDPLDGLHELRPRLTRYSKRV